MRNGETDFFTIGDKFQICIFSPTYMHLERERERERERESRSEILLDGIEIDR